MWHDVKHLYPGEKMFWLSVLRRTVFDYVLYKGVRSRLLDWKRANQFIFGNVRHEIGLSFEEVCCLFSWDYEYVQRLTKKLTREDVKKLETRKFKDEFVSDQAVSCTPSWVPRSICWMPKSWWTQGLCLAQYMQIPVISWSNV